MQSSAPRRQLGGGGRLWAVAKRLLRHGASRRGSAPREEGLDRLPIGRREEEAGPPLYAAAPGRHELLLGREALPLGGPEAGVEQAGGAGAPDTVARILRGGGVGQAGEGQHDGEEAEGGGHVFCLSRVARRMPRGGGYQGAPRDAAWEKVRCA